MKLKKSFLAKFFLNLAACGTLFCFTGCASTTANIPGSKEIQIQNIYVEYLNIADIYFSLEKWDKAAVYYNYALGNKDIYWEAFYKLAKTYAIQKNWSGALEKYEIIYERDPENASIKASLAYIYAMSGDTQKAKATYEQLINEQEYNQDYYENYLSILIMEKDYAASKAEYEKMAELFPGSKNLEKFQKAVDALKPEDSDKTEEGEQSKTLDNPPLTGTPVPPEIKD